MIGVERVDYIRVPVNDMDEANRFYGELLGLRRNPNSPEWDSGVCNGAGLSDPSGNRILLHRRYAPHADGTMP